MQDEQSGAPDSQSIIERLTGSLMPEPEVAEAEAAPAPAEDIEALPEGDDQAEQAEEAPEDDLYEFVAEDGEAIKVPAKLKSALEAGTDYTRKTQEVARLRQQAEDKAQYNEAREAFMNQAFADASELQVLQNELKRYQQTDWDALYNASPGQALKLQQQMREIERGVAEKQAALAQKGQQIQAAQSRHVETQWQLAEQGALQRIGHLTPADNQAMADQVRALGFDAKEFKAKAADPRLLHAIYKAAKWDALQASKGQAVQKATAAPPVVKPGANQTLSQSANREKTLRANLRAKGSLKDAAALIAARMR